MSWLHRHTEVMAKECGEDGRLAMTVRVDPANAERVRARFGRAALPRRIDLSMPAAREDADRSQQTVACATRVIARLAIVRSRLSLPASRRAETADAALRPGILGDLRSIFALPISVAEREGFFAREGLKLELLIPIPGGADRQIDALHNDSVDVTHVATPFLIRRRSTAPTRSASRPSSTIRSTA